MSDLDRHLDRLFRAARRVPRPVTEEAPFGLQARVLADWRAGRSAEEPFAWFGLLRGGLVCSALILVLSLALHYGLDSQDSTEPDVLTLADSVIQLSMNP
jgi:hypothetical protein